MTLRLTERAETVARQPVRRRRRLGKGATSAVATVVLIVVLGLIFQVCSALGLWSEADVPAPSTVLAEFGRLLGTGEFWGDLGRTALEVLLSIVFGCTLGLFAGVLFWKLPRVGRAFEPYLVSFYAVPLVLFYPVMIVLVGINASSVVILASVMAMIPMALNTTVGLNGIPPVYLKLARSVGAGPRRTLFSIALPAAGPFVIAGLRMGVVYSLIGAIAMEFTTAQAGLGYRIRYLYETFESEQMFGYIFAVLVLSCAITLSLQGVERVLATGGRR
ncbi:ABC transporter permease [Sciscionella sediminilitoris]|uniref:ABC transporter permease n=1 Tax=Sciscionella sediminilitoris TaxID=1445613 RepID=UPI000690D9D7|nr:ABC transporter permease [Sciscionella sp. SE31]